MFSEENYFHERKKSIHKFHEEKNQHATGSMNKNQHAKISLNKISLTRRKIIVGDSRRKKSTLNKFHEQTSGRE